MLSSPSPPPPAVPSPKFLPHHSHNSKPFVPLVPTTFCSLPIFQANLSSPLSSPKSSSLSAAAAEAAGAAAAGTGGGGEGEAASTPRTAFTLILNMPNNQPANEHGNPAAQLEDAPHTNGSGSEDPGTSPKLLTLVIVDREGQVLLGMKKRGFGEGYFNGFGGKVESGETIEDAAIRELEEEAGITTDKLVKRGVLTFHFDDKPRPWEVHVFHASHFRGEPCETDEMCPIWFSHADIPFEKMWKDDQIWYPHFLEGRSFRGEFCFHNTHELVSHSFKVVQAL